MFWTGFVKLSLLVFDSKKAVAVLRFVNLTPIFNFSVFEMWV